MDAINDVSAPKITIKFKILLVCSKTNDIQTIKKTPAVTNVAAWIKDDTGVGPSIASGNHVCKPSWADFPTAPKNKKILIIFNKLKSKFKKFTNWCLKKGTNTANVA